MELKFRNKDYTDFLIKSSISTRYTFYKSVRTLKNFKKVFQQLDSEPMVKLQRLTEEQIKMHSSSNQNQNNKKRSYTLISLFGDDEPCKLHPNKQKTKDNNKTKQTDTKTNDKINQEPCSSTNLKETNLKCHKRSDKKVKGSTSTQQTPNDQEPCSSSNLKEANLKCHERSDKRVKQKPDDQKPCSSSNLKETNLKCHESSDKKVKSSTFSQKKAGDSKHDKSKKNSDDIKHHPKNSERETNETCDENENSYLPKKISSRRSSFYKENSEKRRKSDSIDGCSDVSSPKRRKESKSKDQNDEASSEIPKENRNLFSSIESDEDVTSTIIKKRILPPIANSPYVTFGDFLKNKNLKSNPVPSCSTQNVESLKDDNSIDSSVVIVIESSEGEEEEICKQSVDENCSVKRKKKKSKHRSKKKQKISIDSISSDIMESISTSNEDKDKILQSASSDINQTNSNISDDELDKRMTKIFNGEDLETSVPKFSSSKSEVSCVKSGESFKLKITLNPKKVSSERETTLSKQEEASKSEASTSKTDESSLKMKISLKPEINTSKFEIISKTISSFSKSEATSPKPTKSSKSEAPASKSGMTSLKSETTSAKSEAISKSKEICKPISPSPKSGAISSKPEATSSKCEATTPKPETTSSKLEKISKSKEICKPISSSKSGAISLKPETTSLKSEKISKSKEIFKPITSSPKSGAISSKPEATSSKSEATASQSGATISKPETTFSKSEPISKSKEISRSITSSSKSGATSSKPETSLKSETTASKSETSYKPETKFSKPEGTASKSEAKSKFKEIPKSTSSSSKPGVISSKPEATTLKSEATSSKPEATSLKPETTSSRSEAMTFNSKAVTSKPELTSPKPESASSKSKDISYKPKSSSSKHEELSSKLMATCSNKCSKLETTCSKPDIISSKLKETTPHPELTSTKPESSNKFKATSSKSDVTPSKPEATSSKQDATSKSIQPETKYKPKTPEGSPNHEKAVTSSNIEASKSKTSSNITKNYNPSLNKRISVDSAIGLEENLDFTVTSSENDEASSSPNENNLEDELSSSEYLSKMKLLITEKAVEYVTCDFMSIFNNYVNYKSATLSSECDKEYFNKKRTKYLRNLCLKLKSVKVFSFKLHLFFDSLIESIKIHMADRVERISEKSITEFIRYHLLILKENSVSPDDCSVLFDLVISTRAFNYLSQKLFSFNNCSLDNKFFDIVNRFSIKLERSNSKTEVNASTIDNQPVKILNKTSGISLPCINNGEDSNAGPLSSTKDSTVGPSTSTEPNNTLTQRVSVVSPNPEIVTPIEEIDSPVNESTMIDIENIDKTKSYLTSDMEQANTYQAKFHQFTKENSRASTQKKVSRTKDIRILNDIILTPSNTKQGNKTFVVQSNKHLITPVNNSADNKQINTNNNPMLSGLLDSIQLPEAPAPNISTDSSQIFTAPSISTILTQLLNTPNISTIPPSKLPPTVPPQTSTAPNTSTIPPPKVPSPVNTSLLNSSSEISSSQTTRNKTDENTTKLKPRRKYTKKSKPVPQQTLNPPVQQQQQQQQRLPTYPEQIPFNSNQLYIRSRDAMTNFLNKETTKSDSSVRNPLQQMNNLQQSSAVQRATEDRTMNRVTTSWKQSNVATNYNQNNTYDYYHAPPNPYNMNSVQSYPRHTNPPEYGYPCLYSTNEDFQNLPPYPNNFTVPNTEFLILDPYYINNLAFPYQPIPISIPAPPEYPSNPKNLQTRSILPNQQVQVVKAPVTQQFNNKNNIESYQTIPGNTNLPGINIPYNKPPRPTRNIRPTQNLPEIRPTPSAEQLYCPVNTTMAQMQQTKTVPNMVTSSHTRVPSTTMQVQVVQTRQIVRQSQSVQNNSINTRDQLYSVKNSTNTLQSQPILTRQTMTQSGINQSNAYQQSNINRNWNNSQPIANHSTREQLYPITTQIYPVPSRPETSQQSTTSSNIQGQIYPVISSNQAQIKLVPTNQSMKQLETLQTNTFQQSNKSNQLQFSSNVNTRPVNTSNQTRIKLVPTSQIMKQSNPSRGSIVNGIPNMDLTQRNQHQENNTSTWIIKPNLMENKKSTFNTASNALMNDLADLENLLKQGQNGDKSDQTDTVESIIRNPSTDSGYLSPNKQGQQEPPCARCLKDSQYYCSGCLIVYYCSFQCQNEAWPSHRNNCLYFNLDK